jgi:hypothetical protein
VTDLEDLILGLADGIPDDAGGPEAGIRVELTSIDLEVPVETLLGLDGRVHATLPRGRLATGHDPIHSRIALRFDRQGAA